MRTVFRIFGLCSVLLIIGLAIGCDDVHGSVSVKGKNLKKVDLEVTVSGGFRFLRPEAVSEPKYTITLDGYPYNRVLLNASLISTNFSGDQPISTITPMQLVAGSQVPIVISVGPNAYSYSTTIVTASNLPS